MENHPFYLLVSGFIYPLMPLRDSCLYQWWEYASTEAGLDVSHSNNFVKTL